MGAIDSLAARFAAGPAATICTGVITATSPLTVQIDGSTDLPDAQCLSSYVPAIGDVVAVAAQGTDFLILGLIDIGAAPAACVPLALVDAKGDLIVGTANDVVARLPVGSNAQVLTADSTQTLGVKWATPATPTVDAWHAVGTTGEPAYGTGWAANPSFPTDGPAFTLRSGVVHLSGFTKGSVGASTTAFTLPAGYRPRKTMFLQCLYDGAFVGNGSPNYLTIQSNGVVAPSVALTIASAPYLDGLSFVAV